MKQVAIVMVLASVVGCSGSSFDIAAFQDPPADADAIGANPETGEEVDAVETDALTESGPDTRVVDAPVDVDGGGLERTAVDFPESDTTVVNQIDGKALTFQEAASLGYYYRTKGDYAEDAFSRKTPVRKIDVDLILEDLTSSCAIGTRHDFAVKVNDAVVGHLSFSTVSPGRNGVRHVFGVFGGFVAAPTVTGKVRVKIEAITSVCSGGGSWTWKAGGTVVLQ